VVEERAAPDGREEPEEDPHRDRPGRCEQDQLRGDRKALLHRLVHRVVAVDEARAELECDHVADIRRELDEPGLVQVVEVGQLLLERRG
jgi:RecB family exonuclease